jgi:hypothetical protein
MASSKNFPDDMHDTILDGIIRSGKSFSRITNFASLLNTNNIKRELDEGKTDTLDAASGVYGFEVAAEDVDALGKLKLVQSDLQKALEETAEAIKVQRDKIVQPVHNFVIAAQKARDEAARAKLSADKLAALDAYDAGSLEYNNRLIEGEGGGQRLTIRMRGGANPRADVYGNHGGYRTSLNQIRIAFNLVSPFLYGDKDTDATRSARRGHYGLHVGNVREHTIYLKEKIVSLGCQTVNIAELERFAKKQGWALDGSPVPA